MMRMSLPVHQRVSGRVALLRNTPHISLSNPTVGGLSIISSSNRQKFGSVACIFARGKSQRTACQKGYPMTTVSVLGRWIPMLLAVKRSARELSISLRLLSPTFLLPLTSLRASRRLPHTSSERARPKAEGTKPHVRAELRCGSGNGKKS